MCAAAALGEIMPHTLAILTALITRLLKCKILNFKEAQRVRKEEGGSCGRGDLGEDLGRRRGGWRVVERKNL